MNDDDFLVRREDIDGFVHDVLLDPGRRMPVVGITTPWSRRAWLSAADLQEDLGVDVHVCLMETGDTTRRLTELLPERLDVYGGALRIWWPGLAEDSAPLDHPLIFISAQGMVDAAREQVLAILEAERPATPPSDDRPFEPRAAQQRRPLASPAPLAQTAPAPEKLVETATVEAIEGKRITIWVGRERGVIGYADIKLDALARRLRPQQEVQVFRTQATRQGMSVWSIQGLLDAEPPRATAPHLTAPRPAGPWSVIAQEYRVGDIVHARIIHIERYFVLVELLPDAKAIVHVSELAHEWTEDPSALFEVGQPVQVELLALDPSSMRCEASIKRAFGREARPPLDGRNEALGKGLEAVGPLASETSFLRAVRVEYAQQFDEGDRFRYPLQRMLVGREFLERVRALHGIDVDELVEACAQVASGRAHEIAARQVHERRSGEGGAPPRMRGSEGARAWRCSLRLGTAAARRLHWWSMPGSEGPTIEFASVAVHDELRTPE